MEQNEPKSGLDAFNEVPSWYADEPASQAQVPPAPNQMAPASPLASDQMGQQHRMGQQTSGGGMGRFAAGAALKVGIFGLFVGGGFLLNLGSTSADDLAVGDCFIMELSEEIERVDTPSCDESHDAQIVGVVADPTAPVAYPSDSDVYWDEVYMRCNDLADRNVTNPELLPADAALEMLVPAETAWRQGDRESRCVLYAPGGLEGSFVAES